MLWRYLDAAKLFDFFENATLFKRRMRESVFINCWHRNQDDSAAMWALYGKSGCAVALTSTVGQLADTLRGVDNEHDIAIERVEYVKHWRDLKLDVSPAYARIFAYKTKAYEYEKEVRFIIDRTGRDPIPESFNSGIVVPIDPSRLLRSIVIAPDAPPWFEQLVRQSARFYGIRAPVRRSKLATDPI